MVRWICRLRVSINVSLSWLMIMTIILPRSAMNLFFTIKIFIAILNQSMFKFQDTCNDDILWFAKLSKHIEWWGWKNQNDGNNLCVKLVTNRGEQYNTEMPTLPIWSGGSRKIHQTPDLTTMFKILPNLKKKYKKIIIFWFFNAYLHPSKIICGTWITT